MRPITERMARTDFAVRTAKSQKRTSAIPSDTFSYTTTFVPSWWIRQTGTWRAWALLLTCSEDEDNSLLSPPSSILSSILSSLLPARSNHPHVLSRFLQSFSLFPRAPSPPRQGEKTRLRTCSLGRNPTVTRGRLTERMTVLETTRGT
jgi:hypothetical protein